MVGSLALLALFGAVDVAAPSLQVAAATAKAPQKITVTFNSENGSKVASQKINKGAKVAKPKAPTKKGFIFAGWYSDAKLTKAFNFATALKANTTLYAKWTATVSVTFNSEGGSKIATKVIAKGAKLAQPAAPQKTNFTFAGWYSDAKLTKAFNFKNAFQANTTLYAKWTLNLTYTYNANGTATVTGFAARPTSGALSIPSTVTKSGKTYKVTSIGNGAFAYDKLTSLSLPTSLTTIGKSAFIYNSLTSVTVPNGVTLIDEDAFMDNHLNSLSLPNTVKTIGNAAFNFN